MLPCCIPVCCSMQGPGASPAISPSQYFPALNSPACPPTRAPLPVQVLRLDRRLHPVLAVHLPAGAHAYLLLPAAGQPVLWVGCFGACIRPSCWIRHLSQPHTALCRCGSARASTTRAAPPSCTASASERAARRRWRLGARQAGPRRCRDTRRWRQGPHTPPPPCTVLSFPFNPYSLAHRSCYCSLPTSPCCDNARKRA